jgi:hypothetical protein
MQLRRDSGRVADDVVVEPEIERTEHRIPVFLSEQRAYVGRETDGGRRRWAVGRRGSHRPHREVSRIITQKWHRRVFCACMILVSARTKADGPAFLLRTVVRLVLDAVS